MFIVALLLPYVAVVLVILTFKHLKEMDDTLDKQLEILKQHA